MDNKGGLGKYVAFVGYVPLVLRGKVVVVFGLLYEAK